MKNKIVIITFETYLQEAHPHSLETMEYIAENYDMIEEFKIVEMSGMIVKDESEVVIKKDDLQKITIAATNFIDLKNVNNCLTSDERTKLHDLILSTMCLLNA